MAIEKASNNTQIPPSDIPVIICVFSCRSILTTDEEYAIVSKVNYWRVGGFDNFLQLRLRLSDAGRLGTIGQEVAWYAECGTSSQH